MEKQHDKTISVLNNLIETCKDGEEGFRHAAEAVKKNEHLRSLFMEFSEQRAELKRQLQEQVRLLGGDPERTSSVAGSLHRGWINLKGTLTGHDEAAIISECERGEDEAKANYRDALQENLEPTARELVERQAAIVKETHDRVRNLEVKIER